ncbi:major facilitator superfamily transporter [Xylariomycetidae sp. FL0641]|nr:major facilitator superfamily transporter [Xylariomycetidae sp. FL0641]
MDNISPIIDFDAGHELVSLELRHPSRQRSQSSKESDEAQQHPVVPEWQPTGHEKAIIYTLAMINLIVALDATILVTPLNVRSPCTSPRRLEFWLTHGARARAQTITEELRGTATQAFWMVTSYLLVNAVTMPVVCAVSDVFGRPICLTFALAAFTLGTVLCCTAHDVGQMLAGRSVQGVGGGGIHSLSLVTQTDIVPLRYRPKWYGVTLAAWSFGLALGPIIGGAVVHATTWRWVFYLMFPVCAAGLVLIPYLLTLRPRQATFKEKLLRIDWFGSLLFTASATSFLVAISWGGNENPWGSAQTLVPLILGLLGLVVTVAYEVYFAKQPFLRRSLWHDRTATVTYMAGGIQGIVMYGLLYYGPFYFLSVKKFSALDTGVAMLHVTITVTLAGIIVGRLVTRFNNFRWPICIGWFVASVGAAMYLVWPHNNSAGVWVMSYLVIGIGQGTVLNAQNFASQATCKPGDEAASAAMYAFVRQFGMALGVGIGGTAFQNVMALKLRWSGLPHEIAKQSEAYLSTLHSLPPSEFRQGVYDAYNYGFMGVYSFFLGMSILALVMCLLFVKNIDLNRNIQSEHRLDGDRMRRHWDMRGR